jgi:translation initiation factor 1
MPNRLVYQEFGSDALERPEAEAIDILPEDQNPRIQASRKGRKGKTVTVISGLQGKVETLEALLKLLKNQCGAGGTLKEDEIEIQGDHGAKILQILSKLGYKAKISGG